MLSNFDSAHNSARWPSVSAEHSRILHGKRYVTSREREKKFGNHLSSSIRYERDNRRSLCFDRKMGTHWTSFDLNAYIEYLKRKIAGSKSSCVASHSWYFATVKCLSSHLDKRAFVYTTTTKSWNWSQSSYKRRPNFSLSLLLSLVCVFISVIILEATGGAGKRLKTTREHEWNETFNYSCLRSFLRLTNAFRFSLSRFAITFFSSSTFTWNIVS